MTEENFSREDKEPGKLLARNRWKISRPGGCGDSVKRGQAGPKGKRHKAWPADEMDPAEGIQNSRKASGKMETRLQKLKSKEMIKIYAPQVGRFLQVISGEEKGREGRGREGRGHGVCKAEC